MHRLRAISACLLLAALACGRSAHAAPARSGGALARPAIGPVAQAPARAQVFDLDRRIDVNDLNAYVTNVGWFGYDPTHFSAGLFYPNHTAKTALYAGGLWIGAQVAGQTRVAVAEYSTEYQPGRILPVGTPEDPGDPRLIVYKVKRWTGVPSDSAHVDNPGANPAL
ncbi:MAG TPA: hypothetical protein VI792_12465, partial [Candidatus Eisenbacteria bacterium]